MQKNYSNTISTPSKQSTSFKVGQISLSLLFVAASANASLVTFQTGDFSSGWSSHVDPLSTGTANAWTEATGGNPGAYRRVSLTVSPFQSVSDAQLWSGAEFNPLAQGAVSSVSLAYDIARVFSSHAAATQVVKGIAVRQDGVIYTAFLGISVVTPPDWEAVSVADIVPLFPLVDWANGNTITFGFYDSVGTSADGFTIDGGYDNFRVDVNYTPAIVPEPSTYIAGALLFLPFGAHLIRRLRARS